MSMRIEASPKDEFVFDSKRAKNLSGQVFGKLTVIKCVKKSTNGFHWLCKCECGNERVVLGTKLKNRGVKTCIECRKKGGRKFADLTNQKFGLWFVLNFSHLSKYRQSVWRCQCECGALKLITAGELRSGSSQGCRGCKAKRQQRVAFKRLWTVIVGNAKSRNLEFLITSEYIFDLLEKQKGTCALTGLPIKIALSSRGHTRGGTSASLDRIDSSKGYIPGNVQWVHKHVNQMKWDLSQERFIEICLMVAKRFYGMVRKAS